MKINLTLNMEDQCWTEPFLRDTFKDAMEERGIQWNTQDGDIEFIAAEVCPVGGIQSPHVLYDRVDQACFGNQAREVVNNSTIGVIKPVSYVSTERHNMPTSEGRHLGWLLGGKQDEQRKPVGKDVLNKTKACTSLAHQYSGMWPWMQDVPLDEIRRIDAVFIGNTHYSGVVYPFLHRKALCQAMSSLPRSLHVCSFDVGVHGYHPMSAESYLEVFKRSKVVVSPFGIGEYAYRDHMAMIAGCALVKPECPEIEVSFDPYRHAVRTPFDWSKLEEAIVCAMDAQPAAEHYALSVVPKLFDTSQLADIMAKHIQGFIDA